MQCDDSLPKNVTEGRMESKKTDSVGPRQMLWDWILNRENVSCNQIKKKLQFDGVMLVNAGPAMQFERTTTAKASLMLTRTGHARTMTRTRTSLTVTYCKLQLNLQSLSSNNNEHKVKVHNI